MILLHMVTYIMTAEGVFHETDMSWQIPNLRAPGALFSIFSALWNHQNEKGYISKSVPA